MGKKTKEQKRQELAQKFENKKTNFLDILFKQVDVLRAELNELSVEYKELEETEEDKQTKKK